MVSFASNIVEQDIADEMRDSFVPYALSVIMDRALPDVRDGLKPVQRRILFTGSQMGLAPGTKTRKSARIVGEVMGKYHPHGDGAIYEALVRMAQDHSLRLPLIDPQGNFGSLDDNAAAARYTECRLTPAAVALLEELGEDTVDFHPNFDGELSEPSVLPASIPNLLVNGSMGIAVGLATSLPPHNLAEVVDVIRLIMTQRRPKPTTAEMLELLPGPDLPGGGTVIVDENFESMYETGRGTFRIRATAVIDSKVAARRQGIVVTELPYLVGPEKLVAKIQAMRGAGRLDGIADVKNLTDRHGIRIQVICKVGANPEAVLQDLYKLTPMEETMSFNANVLVGGLPRLVGLREQCELFVEHRVDVIVRRTQHRLAKAEQRLHITVGLLKALDAIDEVVKIIRGSDDTADARTKLMSRLSIDETQANHILELQLRRLAKLEKLKLEKLRDDLTERIAGYNLLLGSETRQRTLLLKELDARVAELGTDRRTRIVAADQVALTSQPVSAVIADDPCTVDLSTSGLVSRSPAGRKAVTPGRHDVLASRLRTTTMSPLLGISTLGRGLSMVPAEAPELQGRSRGVSANDIFDVRKGEDIVALSAPPESDDTSVLLITSEGRGKRLGRNEFDVALKANSGTVFGLKNATDRVVAAFDVSADDEVLMVTAAGQVLRCRADAAPVQGLSASGSLMMTVDESRIIAAGLVAGTHIIAVTNSHSAKATPSGDIPAKGPRGKGVRLGRFRRDESSLIAAGVTVLSTAAGIDNDGSPRPVGLPESARDTPYEPGVTLTAIGEAR